MDQTVIEFFNTETQEIFIWTEDISIINMIHCDILYNIDTQITAIRLLDM